MYTYTHKPGRLRIHQPPRLPLRQARTRCLQHHTLKSLKTQQNHRFETAPSPSQILLAFVSRSCAGRANYWFSALWTSNHWPACFWASESSAARRWWFKSVGLAGVLQGTSLCMDACIYRQIGIQENQHLFASLVTKGCTLYCIHEHACLCWCEAKNFRMIWMLPLRDMLMRLCKCCWRTIYILERIKQLVKRLMCVCIYMNMLPLYGCCSSSYVLP